MTGNNKGQWIPAAGIPDRPGRIRMVNMVSNIPVSECLTVRDGSNCIPDLLLKQGAVVPEWYGKLFSLSCEIFPELRFRPV